MTPLHPTNLIAVPVPEEAQIFGIVGKIVAHRVDDFFEPCVMDELDGKFKILGTVTSDAIDFDVIPNIQRTYYPHPVEKRYKDYLNSNGIPLKAIESFRSLLTANDALFENPYGEHEPEDIPDLGAFTQAQRERWKQWQTAQSKVNSKYVILEKV